MIDLDGNFNYSRLSFRHVTAMRINLRSLSTTSPIYRHYHNRGIVKPITTTHVSNDRPNKRTKYLSSKLMYSQLYETIFAVDEEVGLGTPILSYFFNRSSIEIRFLVLIATLSELWTLSDILISTMDAISLSRLDLIPKLLMYWLPTHVRNENYIR